jgi:hypothetical protein
LGSLRRPASNRRALHFWNQICRPQGLARPSALAAARPSWTLRRILRRLCAAFYAAPAAHDRLVEVSIHEVRLQRRAGLLAGSLGAGLHAHRLEVGVEEPAERAFTSFEWGVLVAPFYRAPSPASFCSTAASSRSTRCRTLVNLLITFEILVRAGLSWRRIRRGIGVPHRRASTRR